MSSHQEPPPDPKKDVFFGLSIEECTEEKYSGTCRFRNFIQDDVVRLFSLPVGCNHTTRSPVALCSHQQLY